MDVKNRICEILKAQQEKLCLAMQQYNADNAFVEATTLNIDEWVVSKKHIDYLHVLFHMLTSAQNGGIIELINTSENFIPLKEIRDVLHTVKMGPVELDLNNSTYKHCFDKCNDWIVISYTQQKQLDIIKFTHSADCKCSYSKGPELQMQNNIFIALKELSNTNSRWKGRNTLMVWWDKLPGKLSIECNLVWPALANLHYILQPVLSIMPEIHDNHTIDTDIQQMTLYNRCWPRVERACGHTSKGVYITWQSSLVLCKHVIRAGIVLAFIHQHIRTTNRNELEGTTEICNIHSSILSPLINIAKQIKPNNEHKLYKCYNGINSLMLQQIVQHFVYAVTQLQNSQVLEPKTKLENEKELRQMVKNQLKTLDMYISKCDICINCMIDNMMNKYINNNENELQRGFICTSSTISYGAVDIWTMRSISHVIISTSAAWADAYDDGDKLVAAMVYSNISEAITYAKEWAGKFHLDTHLDKTTTHPFKKLMNISRPIWNTANYNGPCGIIKIGCNKCYKNLSYNNQYSWPGWCMSMCPENTVVKAIKILGFTEQETKNWYLKQQECALKSLVGIGTLRVK
jgi:hypothetical protein